MDVGGLDFWLMSGSKNMGGQVTSYSARLLEMAVFKAFASTLKEHSLGPRVWLSHRILAQHAQASKFEPQKLKNIKYDFFSKKTLKGSLCLLGALSLSSAVLTCKHQLPLLPGILGSHHSCLFLGLLNKHSLDLQPGSDLSSDTNSQTFNNKQGTLYLNSSISSSTTLWNRHCS